MENKKNEDYLNLSLDQIMSDRFGRYSKYIIQDRALPDSRDGLKPVQRRILFSMNVLGLLFNKPFKKSARIVGDVIGKYHPHGDSSIYEALVRMSQQWKVNVPLVEMHGNNGSIDDDPAAAMRYTEARLSKVANHLIDNIKKNTVTFSPNFDDTEKEPTVLPALFPNLLVNGAKGIAAGYATEMPPHNLGEIIDAIIAKIKSPNIKLDTLSNHIHGPDFPTGGKVQGKDGIYQAFERGRGKILIRSTYEISSLKTKPSITITEIPYGVIKAKLVREIDEIRFNNKIDGIKDVRDDSDRNGLSIFIELVPGINVNAVLNYLLSKTEMQIYYNYNNIAIKDKIPMQMGLIALIDSYLNHQKQMQKKALNFDLEKDEKRLEIVEGLIKIAGIADKVIMVIRNSQGSKQGVIENLISHFQFSKLQAEAIAELRLYRLSKTDQSVYFEEQEILYKRIKNLEDILGLESNFNKYLISLLRQLKKEYSQPRKTIIEASMEQILVDMEALIKHEFIWIGISKEGYIKRFSNRIYEANNLKGYTIRENDALVYLQLVNTQFKLLVFTSYGNYIYLPTHKINETKFKEVGKHINDFVVMKQGEQIIGVVAVKDFDVNCYVTLVTKKGKGKRIKIKDFGVSRYTKTYKAINLVQEDKLTSITISNGFKQIVVISKKGKATKYSETQLPIQSPKSSGVKVINVLDDEVVAVSSGSNEDILGFLSNRGGMKRIKMSSIIPMSRTTRGKALFRTIKGNPHIILDSKVVLPQTQAVFSKNVIFIHKFNEVDITSTIDGFSLVNGFNHGALICNYQIVDKKNSYFQEPTTLGQEDKFKEAEATIDAVNQISIDDLLKDI